MPIRQRTTQCLTIPTSPNPATRRREEGWWRPRSRLLQQPSTKKAHAFARPPRDPRNPHCFLRGTHIRTPKGEVEVEKLTVGDLVATLDGRREAHQVDRPQALGARASARDGRRDVLPVKVARSAFGTLVPHTDLFLSPRHAVYLDGLLVPVRNLINGRSIVECGSFAADTIEYFHVELAGHDVIFAEGLHRQRRCWPPSDRAFDNWPGDTGIVPKRLPTDISRLRRECRFAQSGHRSRLRSAVSPWIDRRQRMRHHLGADRGTCGDRHRLRNGI